MPDKHEVGGSSPLGPTSRQKSATKQKKSAEIPRAFLERDVLQKRNRKKQGGRDAKPKEETLKQAARDKHRHFHWSSSALRVAFIPKG